VLIPEPRILDHHIEAVLLVAELLLAQREQARHEGGLLLAGQAEVGKLGFRLGAFLVVHAVLGEGEDALHV